MLDPKQSTDPYAQASLAEAYQKRVAKVFEDLTLRKWAVEQSHGDVERARALYKFVTLPVSDFLQN